MVPLSVLDLIPVVEGRVASQAIADSLALARHVDPLGFERYWIAEHHNTRGNASSSPEIVIAHVAATTRHMRVGAGGVMLPNHAPLRVVETFRTLEAIHPGRIDLGLGRSLGGDAVTSSALRKREADDVDQQLIELIAFATKQFPDDHPFATITPMPSDVTFPPIWLLGSSPASAALAASLGVGFGFGGHFSMSDYPRTVAVYRSQFQRSDAMPEPRLLVSVWAVCGDTEEEAAELALSLRLAYARIYMGGGGAYPTLAEAHDHEWTKEETAAAKLFDRNLVVGSPERVAERLEKLATDTGANELLLATAIPDLEERCRSYSRIAKVCGLKVRS